MQNSRYICDIFKLLFGTALHSGKYIVHQMKAALDILSYVKILQWFSFHD